MVDVEQRALRALEQNALAFAALEIEQPPHRFRIGQQLRRQRGELLQYSLAADFFQIEAAAQRVVVRQQPLDLVRQRIEIGEVHQPNRAAADLVLIGRADAAPRGPDRRDGVGGLPERIEFAMQRQNQRDVFGNAQIVRADGDALPLKSCDFVEERLRIDHDAVADHRQLRGPQHARRQQCELVGFAVDHKGMAGIMTALEARNDVGLLRQPVDDLALSLVAPLGADDDNIGHFADIPSATVSARAWSARTTAASGSGPTAGCSGSCAQPKSRPGPVACEASLPIKDARYRRKLEGGSGGPVGPVQPIDMP